MSLAGLEDLDIPSPVWAAPMAGGATTPALVAAAADADSVGFLAAGYLTPERLADQIADVRSRTGTFGVNLFVPNPIPISAQQYRRYRAALQPEADALGVVLPAEPVVDDDAWPAKLDLLCADPVPVVSFTFGVPDPDAIVRLRRAGSTLLQTVTSPAEARAAAGAGVHGVVVQTPQAGGHHAGFDPAVPAWAGSPAELVAQVRAAVELPVVAAGGVASRTDVEALLAAGAGAVAVGTALLLAEEAGTSAVHAAALTDPTHVRTVVTRAFTGRPARALRTAFTDRHADAPLGYPALHHLTRPLRTAAAGAGRADLVHLWAGAGHQAVRRGTAAQLLAALAG